MVTRETYKKLHQRNSYQRQMEVGMSSDYTTRTISQRQDSTWTPHLSAVVDLIADGKSLEEAEEIVRKRHDNNS